MIVDPETDGAVLRVLALDGGGVRGVLAARFIDRLEAELGRPLQDVFDVIAGTSTGSLIAAALVAPINEGSHGLRARLVSDAYKAAAFEVFPKPRTIPRLIQTAMSRPLTNAPFERLLDYYAGDSPLAGAATEVVMPAYDVGASEPVLLTRSGARRDSNELTTLARAAMASSAAPSYFPPVTTHWNGRNRRLVDGGLFANNPSLLTTSLLMKVRPHAQIRVLSIGTGVDPRSPWSSSNDPRTLRLAAQGGILETMFEASSHAAETATATLLGPSFKRVNFRFRAARPGLDDARIETVDLLTEKADRTWRSTGREVVEFLSEGGW